MQRRRLLELATERDITTIQGHLKSEDKKEITES